MKTVHPPQTRFGGYNKRGMVHVHMGLYCLLKCTGLLSEYLFTLTKSVDPDEMKHFAVSCYHLSIHCLQKFLFMGFLNTKGYFIKWIRLLVHDCVYYSIVILGKDAFDETTIFPLFTLLYP